MLKLLSSVILAALILGANVARAEDPAFLTFSVGAFDLIAKDDTAAEFRVEYRHNQTFWYAKPIVGLHTTTDKSVYTYAGVMWDIYWGRRFVTSLSFAPGAYFQGSGKDLGYPLEFRSQVEVAYRFDNYARLGLSLNHISNANIGDENPGTESVMVNLSWPLGQGKEFKE